MRFARRFSQIFFLSLFLFLFIKTTFPFDASIPHDIFLRSDPLVALVTMLTTRQFIFKIFAAGFLLVILSLIMGRFFCGWVCPMGTIIDAGDRLFAKERTEARPSYRKHRLWKYSLLAIVLIAALFSVQLIWFLDPISLLTRSLTISVYPLFSILAEAIFNLFLKFGAFEDALFSLYGAMRGTILPLTPLLFSRSILILIVFAGILLLGRVTRRYWCRYLCPLGALYGLFSGLRIVRRQTTDDCIDCGRCYKACKMDAIASDFRSYSHHECIECMTCVHICPTNALKYTTGIRPRGDGIDLSRRRFVFSGATALLAVGATKTALVDKSRSGAVIRPPGSVNEQEFLDRCIRCHQCIKVCSTMGRYLQPAWLESGWEGIWTPLGNARHGYCEYDCNLCGMVCPTDAIHELTVSEKQATPMGTAYFDKSRCIPWYKNEDCLVCEEHCPIPDKAIKFEVRRVTKPDGTERDVKYPYVDEELCIGCGICVAKCPLEAKAGIFVNSTGQKRWGDEDGVDTMDFYG